MRWKETNEIIDKLNNAIKEIKEYQDADDFVSHKFQQFMTNGEYDDNSIEVGNYFNALKKIEDDKDFVYKLKFVLKNFVRGKHF